MFRATILLERARQHGGDDECERLKHDIRFRRIFMEDQLLLTWGKELREWPNNTIQSLIAGRSSRPPLPVPEWKTYPFSDHKATFDTFITHLLAFLSWNAICERWREWRQQRLQIARSFARHGTTKCQRFFLPSVLLLCELVMPLLWVSLFLAAVVIRVALYTGVRFPLLSFFDFIISGSGMTGAECLPPGENGYTKVFRGGDDVDLNDLEIELMSRNDASSDDHDEAHGTTISISYKHFANKGSVPGDDHRICRTDLRAIAQLIKAAAPCKLRFWIDAKLPPTDDKKFERWLDRGVRPYGRYITFICPSAQQYAQSSFWLSNEYHFAAAAKGTLYFESDQIFYELRYGDQLDLHRRFFHVLIEAERHPVQVRDQDKGKVIHWAMCCLRAEQRRFQSLSPNIDNFTMVGKPSEHWSALDKIGNVIRKYGPQELPVVRGRSWNQDNLLLLKGVPDQEVDLSEWYGLSTSESPAKVYFVPEGHLSDIRFETVVVMEISLDRPHFTPGKIRVTKKVLCEVSSSLLVRCKFVALPWLVQWE